MTNVVFENAILTNARFGKDASGEWTKLTGANFEGALLSSVGLGSAGLNEYCCMDINMQHSTRRTRRNITYLGKVNAVLPS